MKIPADRILVLVTVLAPLTGQTLAENFSADELYRPPIKRRAVETVIWGMPALNYERMLQAAIDNGANVTRSSIGRGGELEGSDSHAESGHNLPCTK